MNENSLNNKSFENSAGSELHIDFSGNLFTKLHENIFGDYFKNKKNNITFGSTKFECDCDMKWILNIKNQINEIQCANYHNKSIFHLTETDSKCLASPITPSTTTKFYE